jgi:hypothetical protein
MWFYEIRGTDNRLVKRSEPQFDTEQVAIDAGFELHRQKR